MPDGNASRQSKPSLQVPRGLSPAQQGSSEPPQARQMLRMLVPFSSVVHLAPASQVKLPSESDPQQISPGLPQGSQKLEMRLQARSASHDRSIGNPQHSWPEPPQGRQIWEKKPHSSPSSHVPPEPIAPQQTSPSPPQDRQVPEELSQPNPGSQGAAKSTQHNSPDPPQGRQTLAATLE